jgi:hypothetical protein
VGASRPPITNGNTRALANDPAHTHRRERAMFTRHDAQDAVVRSAVRARAVQRVRGFKLSENAQVDSLDVDRVLVGGEAPLGVTP